MPEKDLITLRGERDLWIKFTNLLKEQRKEVWQILQPFIKDYIKKTRGE